MASDEEWRTIADDAQRRLIAVLRHKIGRARRLLRAAKTRCAPCDPLVTEIRAFEHETESRFYHADEDQ